MIEYKIKGDKSDDIIDVVLNNRGLTRQEIELIMNPNIEEYDTDDIYNIHKGIELLDNAISNNVKLGILIDPDNDGYCAAASKYDYITRYLNYRNIELIYHDNAKSHGIDTYVFNKVKELGVGLLIIPDAGSMSDDYVKLKKLLELNIKSLIIDHHSVEYENELDGIVLINTTQKNDMSINKWLSGAAITYKFIKAHSKSKNIDIGNSYIDSAALTLISDMCDMRSLENRVIFNKGSNKSNIESNLINEFIINKNIDGDSISIESCGFAIAPLINATIRKGSQEDKEILFKSFYSGDLVKSNKRGNFGALELAHTESIRRMVNVKKQQDTLVKKSFEKLKKQIIDNELMKDSVLMIDSNDLDNSIAGLIANKISNEFKRPVMMCKYDKQHNTLRGSVRSINSISNLKDIFTESGLFEYCKGHQGSFGHCFNKDKIELIKEYFNEYFKDFKFESVLEVDAAYMVSPNLQDIIDISSLERLWCSNIKEPIFIIKDIELNTSNIMKIGNATYTWKNEYGIQFLKNFGSRVWIEEFTHQAMVDSKAKYPFGDVNILCDIVCKFRKNKGYSYVEIVDTKSKII